MTKQAVRLPTALPNSMLEYRIREYLRLRNDLSAYELMSSAGIFHTAIAKLQRLVRYHRQRVFDPRSGDAHTRAIHRLHATMTARAWAYERDAVRQIQIGNQLARMGY